MEGLSKIVYKGKGIIYTDYSVVSESKEKTFQLIQAIENEIMQYPPNSVLSLTNVQNLGFDTEVLNKFKNSQEKTVQYQKKTAVIGLKGLQQVAYNIVVALTQRDRVKAFDTEIGAKDWLVSD